MQHKRPHQTRLIVVESSDGTPADFNGTMIPALEGCREAASRAPASGEAAARFCFSCPSVAMLASAAAEPFATGQATSVDLAPAAGDSGASASGPASSDAFASDYAMSLLAKITHASADQALSLIQLMLTPGGAGRG